MVKKNDRNLDDAKKRERYSLEKGKGYYSSILMRKDKGITLIALIVTIVVLIILATISINIVFGENGIINRAESAEQAYENGIRNEHQSIEQLEDFLEDIITEPWEKDYQRVEYIESTGEQYLEIDFIPNSNTSSKGKFQIVDINNASVLFGSRNSSSSNFYGLNWGGGSPYKYYNSYYSGSVTDTVIDGNVHTFQKENRILYIDGVQIDTHTRVTAWNGNYKIIIFGCNTNGTIGLLSEARIFKLQFFNEGELAVDLIPCYRKSDNKVGMYDRVNNTFYINKGNAGDFRKGADL